MATASSNKFAGMIKSFLLILALIIMPKDKTLRMSNKTVRLSIYKSSIGGIMLLKYWHKSAIRLYKKLKDRFEDLKISFNHVEGNIVTNIHIKRRMDTTRAYKEEDEAIVLVNN